jgi:hypothetical protein
MCTKHKVMVVTVKKNANCKEAQDAIKQIEQSKKQAKAKGNIAHLFGSNPNETDGLQFQKKARKEWQ